ncbi:hypothetical protein SIM91_16595 [Rhodococcus opacus]|nr:hypothetical protein [Rhodococcus opacus]MDX5964920.1 hypothetical protein [Rhodococcus opacus]
MTPANRSLAARIRGKHVLDARIAGGPISGAVEQRREGTLPGSRS